MAKFYGAIGYVKNQETKPGKWTGVPAEKKYSGEFNRIFKRYQRNSNINDDINISAELSIIADPYLFDQMHNIRYVKLKGVAWEVSSVEPQPPRLILNLGGVYNGEVFRDE